MVIPRPGRMQALGGVGSSAGIEPDLELLPFGPPEGYRLDTTGAAPRIRAQDAAGVAYALTTIGQLPVHGGRLPAVVVEDRPRYPWRGAMLDIDGGVLPVDTVLGVLDDLAALKLNRLHLPLPDEGAYSADEYRAIVEHAGQRHIVVVPGVTVPSRAALDDGRYAAAVHELSRRTPGPWLHIGGIDPRTEDDEQSRDDLDRAIAIAASTGRQLIGWHEIGANERLPVGTIGQYRARLAATMIDAEQLRACTARDGWAILSPSDAAVLDGPTTSDSLRMSYEWDPAELVAGVGEDRVLGVEAIIRARADDDLESIRAIVFPRLCALAELAWSPADTHDYADFTARLRESIWAGELSAE